jgi:hypothetical protein
MEWSSWNADSEPKAPLATRPSASSGVSCNSAVLVERAGVAQPTEEFRARGRVVRPHRMPDPVQRQPLHHAGHAEAVVAVEVVVSGPGRHLTRRAQHDQLTNGQDRES